MIPKTLKDFAYINAHDTAHQVDIDKVGWSNTDASCEELREEAIKRVRFYLWKINLDIPARIENCGGTIAVVFNRTGLSDKKFQNCQLPCAALAGRIEELIEFNNLTENDLNTDNKIS